MFSLVFVVALDVLLCPKDGSLMFVGAPRLSGPAVALVEDVVDFQCEVTSQPQNESVLLQLFKKEDRTWLLAEYTSMGGDLGNFPILVTKSHQGDLVCVARVQNNSKIQPTVSSSHHLKVIEPVRDAELVVLSGPVDMFEGTTLMLFCNVTAGTHLVYRWLLNGRIMAQSLRRHPSHDRLLIQRTVSEDSGSYSCVVSNQFNETQVFTANSSDIVITVKDLVSYPDIDFSIVFRENSDMYLAEVSCQSDRGTPPITFSLYNRTDLVHNVTVDQGKATFTVPVKPGRHSGWFQCRANNGGRVASSRWLALDVVPVSGPVTLRYDYDVGEDFAVIGLRLYCNVAKGSHPRYQWFLNGTLLQGRGSFFWVVDGLAGGSVLLLSVRDSSAGTYQCKVSDSLNSNAAAVSSREQYLDKQVLNRLPVSTVGAVFGCFTFLVCLVWICCWIPVLFRRRRTGPTPRLDMKMDNMESTEDELDVSKFAEDAEVLTAARADGLDQVSDASEEDT